MRSQPALMELAEIFVPNCGSCQDNLDKRTSQLRLTCAMMKDAEMNQTPNRVAWLGEPSRNRFNKSIGDQIASP